VVNILLVKLKIKRTLVQPLMYQPKGAESASMKKKFIQLNKEDVFMRYYYRIKFLVVCSLHKNIQSETVEWETSWQHFPLIRVETYIWFTSIHTGRSKIYTSRRTRVDRFSTKNYGLADANPQPKNKIIFKSSEFFRAFFLWKSCYHYRAFFVVCLITDENKRLGGVI